MYWHWDGLRNWSMCSRRCRKSWAVLTWRKESSRDIVSMSRNRWWEKEGKKTEASFPQWFPVTRGSGYKLKYRNLCLNERKRFCCWCCLFCVFFICLLTVVKHWKRLPREAMEALFLEVLKAGLVSVLGWPFFEQWNWKSSQFPALSQTFCGCLYLCIFSS